MTDGAVATADTGAAACANICRMRFRSCGAAVLTLLHFVKATAQPQYNDSGRGSGLIDSYTAC